MIDRVALIFHRNLGDLFFLDSILVHVPPHFQREYPEQGSPERSFEYLIEDTPESILRMRMLRGHFFFRNAEACVVESGGGVPPAAYRGEDPCFVADVYTLVWHSMRSL